MDTDDEKDEEIVDDDSGVTKYLHWIILGGITMLFCCVLTIVYGL